MSTMETDRVADGRGRSVARSALPHLAMGTMVTTDIAAARATYERLFGMECVRYAPGRMLARDRRAKYQMDHGEPDFFVLDVAEVATIESPQTMFNHWGFTVGSREEVDRIREAALQTAERFRMVKIMPITKMHQAYGFYLYDTDSNWWEIEFRDGRTNDLYFSQGDWDREKNGDEPLINPDLPLASTAAEVVGPDAFLTHGTTDVIDADASRIFYEEVLGLRSVRHLRPAQFTAGGGDFSFVGVTAGPRNAKQSPQNRWILLVDAAGAREIHERATTRREDLGILDVTDPVADADGASSFLIRNADDNWFEVSTKSPNFITAAFEKGDVC